MSAFSGTKISQRAYIPKTIDGGYCYIRNKSFFVEFATNVSAHSHLPLSYCCVIILRFNPPVSAKVGGILSAVDIGFHLISIYQTNSCQQQINAHLAAKKRGQNSKDSGTHLQPTHFLNFPLLLLELHRLPFVTMYRCCTLLHYYYRTLPIPLG